MYLCFVFFLSKKIRAMWIWVWANLILFLSTCILSEHSGDVDSASEGEFCLPFPGPADASSHIHPTVNSLSVSTALLNSYCCNLVKCFRMFKGIITHPSTSWITVMLILVWDLVLLNELQMMVETSFVILLHVDIIESQNICLLNDHIPKGLYWFQSWWLGRSTKSDLSIMFMKSILGDFFD